MSRLIIYERQGVLDPTRIVRVEATVCRHHAQIIRQKFEASIVVDEPSPGEECEDCYAESH